ncbi:MAG: oligoendopeptidase F [Erysipelothrix sp.]|nr:oligoendopeptidase F [Erysipelothrix sp.]
MKEQLIKRNDVPLEQTWDLTHIFKDEEAFQEAVDHMTDLAKQFKSNYEGKISQINETQELVDVIESYQEIMTLYMHTSGYSYLATQTDMSDSKAQNRLGTISMLGSQVMSSLSFFESELNVLDNDFLQQCAEKSKYRIFLEDIIKHKKHQLQPETEKVLQALQPVMSLPDNGYNITKLSDMRFFDFEANGKSYPLSFVQFENSYQVHPDTQVRREAFKQFSKDLRSYQNTIANYYNTQLKKEKIMANLRGFDSVFDYLLENQNVSIDLYHRQIDVIMEELSVHMRKYAKKLQNKLGVETLYYSDLKAPYLKEENQTITYDEAQEMVIAALSILGEDYTNEVQRSFDERWIDWAGNLGKSTGGFCMSMKQQHPYILLSWNNGLSEVFTLAHEIGHAIQSVYTNRRYPNLFETKQSLYTIEAPSPLNEMLLSHYLLKDESLTQWVNATMIENTYYHNFVTHLLEAAFQREVYKCVDLGMDLQADDFNRLFNEQLTKFWGDSVDLDEGAELTWMRQPHYYMGLYSYTYSAGLTISTVMAQRIINEGQVAVDKWLNALSETESQKPLDFAKLVDIDLSTEKPLQETVAFIGSLIDSLE